MSDPMHLWLLELRRQVDALAIAARRFQEALSDSNAAEDLRNQVKRVNSQLSLSLDLDYHAQLGRAWTLGMLRHDFYAELIAIAMVSELWLEYPDRRDQSERWPATVAAAVEKLDTILREAEAETAADHD